MHTSALEFLFLVLMSPKFNVQKPGNTPPATGSSTSERVGIVSSYTCHCDRAALNRSGEYLSDGTRSALGKGDENLFPGETQHESFAICAFNAGISVDRGLDRSVVRAIYGNLHLRWRHFTWECLLTPTCRAAQWGFKVGKFLNSTFQIDGNISWYRHFKLGDPEGVEIFRPVDEHLGSQGEFATLKRAATGTLVKGRSERDGPPTLLLEWVERWRASTTACR